ncbi:MAG: Cof-type HAD-IIB family hydrolase [Lactovum sp.]
MRKIIFLDIDGTLVNFDQTIPDSTIKALKEAKEKGHYLFISTGRSYPSIHKELLDLNLFDGIIASAGANIFWQGKEIYHSYLPQEKLTELAKILDRHEAIYMFQGYNGRFIDAKNGERMTKHFKDHGFDIEKFSFFKQTVIESPYARDDIESGVFHEAKVSLEEIQKEIGNDVKITALSFEDKNEDNSGEFTKAGVNKATGIQFVLEYLELSQKDSLAFGDSANDIEMIQYAEVGVAMGNAIQEVKAVADIITDNISEDGIYKAFKKLQLI